MRRSYSVTRRGAKVQSQSCSAYCRSDSRKLGDRRLDCRSAQRSGLLREGLAETVFAAWKQHKQTRTIAFCSSIRQANFLASHFMRKGVACISLHSRTTEMGRSEAIQALEHRRLDVIFTVDLFNEGVDIPSVD